MAADFQTDAVFLNVGSMDLSANHNIEQNIEVVEEWDKHKKLMAILEEIVAADVNLKIFLGYQTDYSGQNQGVNFCGD